MRRRAGAGMRKTLRGEGNNWLFIPPKWEGPNDLSRGTQVSHLQGETKSEKEVEFQHSSKDLSCQLTDPWVPVHRCWGIRTQTGQVLYFFSSTPGQSGVCQAGFPGFWKAIKFSLYPFFFLLKINFILLFLWRLDYKCVSLILRHLPRRL